MQTTKITSELAKHIVIQSQLLQLDGSLGQNLALDQIINQLGYVQIDTISVVNRAHHQTLWSRSDKYNENKLHELQVTDRKIYEYWAHAMAYMPIENFRYSLPRMKKFQDPKSAWAKSGIEKSKHVIKDVFKRIEQEGSLSSKDFENDTGKKGGVWWDWKPAKVALEILFWQGQLMIRDRNKFQKVYDLTERVLPAGIDLSFPAQNEISRFIIISALQAFGLATEKEIQKFMQPSATRDADLMLAEKKEIRKSLNELIEEREVEKLRVNGLDSAYFMLSKNIELLNSKINSKIVVNFLSPFDNLIIQRERTKQLFDFNYSLECYVPQPKRKFGYFVFPILYGDKLIGRFDPKADRKNKILILRSLYFEPDFKGEDPFIPLFVQRLILFAAFHNCEKISIEKCADKKVLSKIRSELKKQF